MRYLPLALVLSLMSAGCGCGDGGEPADGASEMPTAAPVPPDVVMVMIDTLRADHLGTYGHDAGNSPFIDRLASEGVLYENARANSSWTRPSMASVLTGLYPAGTGVVDERSFDLLADELTMISERFDAAGYSTAGITANPNLNAVFGFVQGFDAYMESEAVWHWMRTEEKNKRSYLDADEVTKGALELAAAVEGPLYLQVVYLEPHTPLRPPKRFRERYVTDEMSKKEKTLALYDAEIAFVDEQVEALLAGLAEQLRPDPIVVLYSDHGEGLYDHPGVPNTREHGFVLYESNLHVPLVFHHSSLASSRRIVEPVELVDIAPTLLDLAGLPVPPELEGTSLAPELRDQGQVTRPPFTVAHTDRSYVSKASIVEADIKLIINRDTEALATNPDADLKKRERKHLELTDPVEVYDLAALRAQGKKERPGKTQIDADPELVQRLRATLETWEAAHPVRPPTRAADDTITPELMEQLKALGYVQ
jgi:arylsulfatase A-like enzyme